MNPNLLLDKVQWVVDEHVRFCNEVRVAVAVSREAERKLAQGQAVLPKFAVEDFVLYGRVRRQGVMPRLMSTDRSMESGRG